MARVQGWVGQRATMAAYKCAPVLPQGRFRKVTRGEHALMHVLDASFDRPVHGAASHACTQEHSHQHAVQLAKTHRTGCKYAQLVTPPLPSPPLSQKKIKHAYTPHTTHHTESRTKITSPRTRCADRRGLLSWAPRHRLQESIHAAAGERGKNTPASRKGIRLVYTPLQH